MFVCASEHSDPIPPDLGKCQLLGSATLGGNPERVRQAPQFLERIGGPGKPVRDPPFLDEGAGHDPTKDEWWNPRSLSAGTGSKRAQASPWPPFRVRLDTKWGHFSCKLPICWLDHGWIPVRSMLQVGGASACPTAASSAGSSLINASPREERRADCAAGPRFVRPSRLGDQYLVQPTVTHPSSKRKQWSTGS